MGGKLRNMASVYLRKGDRFLLLYRIGSRVIADSYTGTAGGHFEPEELNDARDCVLRELREETGLTEQDIYNLKFRYMTLRLKNGEVRQNYYFFAELAEEVDTELIVSKEGKLRWVAIEELEELLMPHSAKYMLQHYVQTGQYTDCLYAGIAVEDGVLFTELKEF